MSETSGVPGASPAPRRARSPGARMAAWQAKRARDLRIIDMLAHGASVKTIAAEEGLTARRTRMLVNEALARRGAEPASGFAQLQVRRLGRALEYAVRAMGHGEIHAIDRVVRIVRELGRYAPEGAPLGAKNVAKTESPDAASD